MQKACLVLLCLAAGCGDGWWGGGGGYGGPLQSFSVGSSECNLVSSAALSGTTTTWNACALEYDAFEQVYTWSFATPSSTGSFGALGPSWFTLSFNLNSAQDIALAVSPVVATQPGHVGLDEVVLAFSSGNGAIAGGTGFVRVGANIIYPGGPQSALDAQLDVNLGSIGTLSGEVSAAIAITPTPIADAGVPDASIVPDAATRAHPPCDADGADGGCPE